MRLINYLVSCSFTRVLFHMPSITIASLSSSPLAIAIAIVVIIIIIGHRRHRHRTSPSPWSSPSPSPSIVIVGDVPCNSAGEIRLSHSACRRDRDENRSRGIDVKRIEIN